MLPGERYESLEGVADGDYLHQERRIKFGWKVFQMKGVTCFKKGESSKTLVHDNLKEDSLMNPLLWKEKL